MSNTTHFLPHQADRTTLAGMVRIAQEAGARLLAVYTPDARPADRDALVAAVQRNEEVSSAGLREALTMLRPEARWLDEALETTTLPDGEWWVVDAVEGNVNHIHGLPDWGVTITLVRDGMPALAVVHQPLGQLTWTAIRGSGARLNGQRLQVSTKSRLDAAIAATGQAEAGQSHTYRRIGDSIGAMLDHVLLVRAAVPSTFPLLQVARGQSDLFWQYAPVLPGVAAGILFVEEAGGVVSRLDGAPWQPGAADILVTTPKLHAESVNVFTGERIVEAA